MREIYFSFYHVLIFIGIFQGFLLAYIFIFNKSFRKKANMALALAVLTLSFSGIWEIIQDLEIEKQFNYINYLPVSNLSLGAIGLYYFVVFLLNPNYRFHKKDHWFVGSFGVLLLFKIIFYFSSLLYPTFIETATTLRYAYRIITNFLPIIYLLIVLFSVLKKVNNYHRQLFANFSEIEGKALFWLRNLIYFLFVFSVFWILITIWGLIQNGRIWLFPAIWITTCCILYWLAYFVILRRDVFAIPIFEKEKNETEKPQLSDKTEEHYQRLLQLIQKEKIYQDAQLSMDTLAEKTALSNGYLSKIINQKEGKNFYDFINSYRVAEVKANLTNPDYAHYSILGIGLEAGFKSKSTFNSVFKKMTGMTPSAFKKSL